MEKISEKKRIKLDVKYRVERGEPKQQILEELSLFYKDKVTLVKQIKITPSKAAKVKYGIYNYLLAILLMAALVLDFTSLFRIENGVGPGQLALIFNIIICIGLDAIFLAGVMLYRIEIYNWIATRAFITLITIVISLGYFQLKIHPVIYLSLLLIIISSAIGWALRKRLWPDRVPKVIEVDIDGVEKIKKTILVHPD